MFSATAGKCLSSVEGFEGDVPTKATCVALNSFPDDCDVITGYHNGFIKRHSLLLGLCFWLFVLMYFFSKCHSTQVNIKNIVKRFTFFKKK